MRGAHDDDTVAGERDTWMVYERHTSDGYPLIVRARTGNPNAEDALRRGLVSVVHCEAETSLVNDWGMPPHVEQLEALEEGLHREIRAFNIGAFHMANVTGDGQRQLVFAHVTPLEFDPILGLFSVPGYTLHASQPTDREQLVNLVTPTNVERQLNGDLNVISNLEKNGDDGHAPRKTDFWFYGEKAALEQLAAELGALGYSIDHWLDDPVGVVLTRSMPVDFDTFKGATPELVAAADRHRATYDGWETLVVHTKPTPLPDAPPPQSKSLLSKLFGAKKS